MIEALTAELPRHRLARLASIAFSASVLASLISIAVSQSFLALASLLYFGYLLVARSKPRIAFPPVKLPLAIFCLWTVISLAFARYPAAGGFVVRKLTLFLILLLTVNLVVSAVHLRFLLKALFVEAAIAGCVSVAQFVSQYQRVRVGHPHQVYFYMTLTRITGFQGHWMNFGGQQMLAFSALLALLLVSTRTESGEVRPHNNRNPFTSVIRSRSVWWIPLGIVTLSIVLNLTRGVWLGCFVAGIYLIARWRARWLWALPAIVILTLVAGPRMLKQREESVIHPRRDVSLAERFEMWDVGSRMVRKHPLVGVGPDNIPGLYIFYMPPGTVPIVGYHDHLHNDLIQLAAERGLPCLAAWLWLMVAFLYGCWLIRRRGGDLRWVADAGIAAWLALMVEGCFEYNFGSSPVLMVFLFVIAAPFALQAGERAGAALVKQSMFAQRGLRDRADPCL